MLPVTSATAPESDTALGDWYANRFVVDRRPLLLLVSARSLLPILLPARDLRSLPTRLPELVAQRLRRFGTDRSLIDAEVSAMKPVHVAKTASRSVLGIMVDFAFAVPFRLGSGQWDETTLPFVEAKLERTPCFVTRPDVEGLFPDQATRALLQSRWGAG